MLDQTRYFDYAASTPVDPRVLAEMLPFLGGEYANAHSIHQFGRHSRAAVEQARERVAKAVGAEDPSQIIFTSGATEACALAMNCSDGAFVSPFEHSAVMEIAISRRLGIYQWNGQTLTRSDGHVHDGFSAVMRVNNVTGRILHHPAGAAIRFTDATQALGKVALNVTEDDMAAFSAHKIYGPKGVGALYAKDPNALKPMLVGGGQESGYRSGTLNVPGIVAFGLAAELAADEMEMRSQHARELREIVLEQLAETRSWREIAAGAGVPNILGIAFMGIEGESMVLEMDAEGFAISAGPACSSGLGLALPPIMAENLPDGYTRGAIRVSFGVFNTRESARDLGKALAKAAVNLRRLR